MFPRLLRPFAAPEKRFQRHGNTGTKIPLSSFGVKRPQTHNSAESLHSVMDPEKRLSEDSTGDHPLTARLKRTWVFDFSRRLRRLVLNWWLWELVSISLSALCLCFIGLLLGLCNNQVIPKELPLGFTLNTYIAILSAFFKYTLATPVDTAMGQLKWIWFRSTPKPLMDFERFDEASRGPWGSMVLFIRTRGR